MYDPRNEDRTTEKTEHELREEALFNKFMFKFNRNYQTATENDMRLRIFKNNLFKIDQLNKREQGTAKYGITEFADMTSGEYRKRTGLLPSISDTNELKNPIARIPNADLPKSFDWRDKNIITEVN